MKRILLTLLLLTLSLTRPSFAAGVSQETGAGSQRCDGGANSSDTSPNSDVVSTPPPVVTRHHFSLGATQFDYTASAGELLIRDENNKPTALVGYFAYSRDRAAGSKPRPLLFAFNGGPGGSSAFLHMGLLGPKRALLPDPAQTATGAVKIADNPYSVLDKADLVLIDPVSTGESRAVCGHNDKDFWTVDADTDSIGRFIRQYLTVNDRWASPKYVIGESYGTIRAATVANYLRARSNIILDGVILLSDATDIEIIWPEIEGNDRPWAMYLPSFTAVAWYHHRLPGPTRPLEAVLADARQFAAGPYTAALMKGNAISPSEEDAVAQKMATYTGLSADYIKAARLRITEGAFGHELLKDQGVTVSRLDGRVTGITQDSQAKISGYDPLLATVNPVYGAALLDYLHSDLRFDPKREYRVLNYDAGNNWTWSHRPIGVGGDDQPLVNAGPDLAVTVVQEPSLRVLVLQGYFDLGTAFFGMEYMVSHLDIPRSEKSRIAVRYYPSGHMIYRDETSIRMLKTDLDRFLTASQ